MFLAKRQGLYQGKPIAGAPQTRMTPRELTRRLPSQAKCFDHIASDQHDARTIAFGILTTSDHRVTECSGT
jgi:hypothetical protein